MPKGINEDLNAEAIPFMQRNAPVVFQQDNARPHVKAKKYMFEQYVILNKVTQFIYIVNETDCYVRYNILSYIITQTLVSHTLSLGLSGQ
jgi:hypothetical protein